MHNMEHMRSDYQEIAKDQLAELHRRHPHNLQTICEQLLTEQK